MPNTPPPKTPHSSDAVNAEAARLQAQLGEDFEAFLHNLVEDATHQAGSPEAPPNLEELFKRQAFRNLAEFKLRIQHGYKLAIDELRGDSEAGS
jgi:hypothetical protein